MDTLTENFDPELIENLLSFHFKNSELLKRALTHTSVLNENLKSEGRICIRAQIGRLASPQLSTSPRRSG